MLGVTLSSAFLLFPSPLLLLLPPSGYGIEGQGSQAAERGQGKSRKKGWKFQTLSIWKDRMFLLKLSGGDGRVLNGNCHYYIREKWKMLPAWFGG